MSGFGPQALGSVKVGETPCSYVRVSACKGSGGSVAVILRIETIAQRALPLKQSSRSNELSSNSSAFVLSSAHAMIEKGDRSAEIRCIFIAATSAFWDDCTS